MSNFKEVLVSVPLSSWSVGLGSIPGPADRVCSLLDFDASLAVQLADLRANGLDVKGWAGCAMCLLTCILQLLNGRHCVVAYKELYGVDKMGLRGGINV